MQTHVRATSLMAAMLTLNSAFAETSGDLPAAWPKERYEKMTARSPFALATPVAPPVAEAASFAANLYVTGLAKIGDQDCVFISSRDQQTRYALFSGEPGPEGITLNGIEWSDQVGKSKVRITKNGELGVLEFDQAVIQTPVAAANPEGQPAAAPVPQPGIPAPPVIRGPNQVFQPGQIPGKQRNGESRRRIRIIPSRPQ